MSIYGQGRTAKLVTKFPATAPGARGARALVKAAARCGPRLVRGYGGAKLASTQVACRRH